MENLCAGVFDQTGKILPDRRIERAALGDFHVVDAERARALVDAVHGVTLSAEVADRDVERGRIGSCRSKQDGLLRATSGAEHAAELQNANRRVKAVLHSTGGNTRTWAAGSIHHP